YEVPTASAAELSTIDAEALEAANAAEQPPADVELASAPASSVSGALADGTWTGYAPCGQGNLDGWKPYYVGVTVNVSGGKSQGIASIFGSSTGNPSDAALSWDAAENQGYLDWADAGRNGETGVRAQVNAMAQAGSLSGVDTVSKATYSSAAIYNAYVDALGKAAAAAGGAPAELPAAVDPAAPSKGEKPAKKPEKAKTDVEVGVLADGTFEAFVQCGPDPDDVWKPYYVGLALTVEDGAVTSIDKIAGSSSGEKGSPELDWDEAENQVYLTWAIAGRVRAGVEYAGVKEQVERALANGENPASIDVVSGATFSSKSVFEAFYAALAKSAKAAGSTIEEPDPTPTPEPEPEPEPTPDPAPGPVELPEGVPSIHGDFPDGTYTGYALCGVGNEDGWQPYYLVVEVQAEDGAIVKVVDAHGDSDGVVDPAYVYDGAENSVYLNRALNYNGLRLKGVKTQVQSRLDAGSEVTGVDVVSNATYSCDAFLDAFYEAVKSAHDAALSMQG
ncbi:MAG: FMN-binding protein, partial [Eggerthellaceae bacterium]|nr:FMN-binding protein [Eggerthellaceae bacterium]